MTAKPDFTNDNTTAMRTRFHYEIEAKVNCEHCRELVPIGPLRSFKKNSRMLATICPSCGKSSLLRIDIAGRLLRSWANMDTLWKLGHTPDQTESFDIERRQKQMPPYHYSIRGRVGGAHPCTHCGIPIDVPAELPPDQSTAVKCTGCGNETFFVPPPIWLSKEIPQVSHLLYPLVPPEMTCSGCGAKIAAGPNVPPDIVCDNCGASIVIHETLLCPDGVDHERMKARLALTVSSVESEKSNNNPLIGISIALLLSAAGVVFQAISSGGIAGAFQALAMFFLASVVALIGIVLLIMGLRIRKQNDVIATGIRRINTGDR